MNNYSLQMPDILEVAEDSDNFGTFILQPLERGFGVTIGNSFRRVLLSSLPGLAITAVRINGVDHEYSSIEGVKEDVYEIILNLTEVRFKQVEQSGGVCNLVKEERGSYVAGDSGEATDDFEILSPDHVIATLSEGVRLEIVFRVSRGRGYVPSEEMADNYEGERDLLPIDAIFTPMKSVQFDVRSEEHTSELQSRGHLVCRLLLEKKKLLFLNCRLHLSNEFRYL